MKILAKKDVPEVLLSWSRKFDVLCPTIKDQGDCIFDIFSKESFTLEYRKPPMPPKSVFLPQSEVIFSVDNGEYTPVIQNTNIMLFGIRACDLMGIKQAKSFYFRDREDAYFKAHSEGTILIVHACSWPQNETCFCTTMHSGPYAENGFDLQFFDMGNDFLVETGSETGKKLADSAFFKTFEQGDANERLARLKRMAHHSIPLVAEVQDAMEILKSGKEPDQMWEKLGEKCITCGGCVHVCPTCTCYNILDKKFTPDSGERIRTWDTCLYSGFTKEASGHNPRATQGQRLKRRHEHKLRYYHRTDIQEALSGCVGCGRCSDFCPVHIGTIEVAKALAGQNGW